MTSRKILPGFMSRIKSDMTSHISNKHFRTKIKPEKNSETR
jgi:hypothetical protein